VLRADSGASIEAIWAMTYDSLTGALSKRYSDFMVTAKYHILRRALEAERKFLLSKELPLSTFKQSL
jgi:hypothetical protein